MLYLRKHPDGPELPAWAEGRWFRSYSAMADWAEEQLPPGKYWSRNPSGASLATAVREVRCKLDRHDNPRETGFWVEGRGNI